MSLYDLAADLFEDIKRVRASAPTASDSWRDPTELEPLVGDELPKLGAIRQDAAEQTPTLDILAGCLEDIHQIRCGAGPASTVKHCTWHNKRDRKDEPDENTKHITLTRKNFQLSNTHRISDGEGNNALARSFPRHISTATHEGFNASQTRWDHPPPQLQPGNQRLVKSDEVPNRADIDVLAAETFAKFEREVTTWKTSVGTTACAQEHVKFAAHLSSKYLCSSLDLMPSSTIVCHLRRELARRIDQVATTVEGVDVEREEPTLDGTELGPRRENVPDDVVVDPPSDDRGDDADYFDINQKRSPISGVIRLAASNGTSTDSPVCGAANAADARIHKSRVTGIQARSLSSTGGGTGACFFSSRNGGGDHRLVNATSTKTLESRGGDTREDARSVPTAPSRSGCSTHVRVPRAKAIRFLMGDAGVGDNTRVLETNRRGEPERQLNEHESTSRQFVVDGILKRCWACVWCDKRNTEGAVVCSNCGRHRDTSYVDNPQADKTVKKRSRYASQAYTGHKQERRGGATRSSEGGREILALCRHSSSPEYSKRAEVKDNPLRKKNSEYDLSSFAKMRQTTEQAVKARLNLTGEIKSLLSVVRGTRG